MVQFTTTTSALLTGYESAKRSRFTRILWESIFNLDSFWTSWGGFSADGLFENKQKNRYSPLYIRKITVSRWSPLPDSNRRPPVYKTGALAN